MHRSLNFLIELDCPLDDSMPGGFEFASEFRSKLAHTCVITREIDNWRDVGWDFTFTADDEEYSVVVSCLAGDNSVLLQISPANAPNALLRVFGFSPTATDVGLERRRSEVDEILANNTHVMHVRFAYDRFP